MPMRLVTFIDTQLYQAIDPITGAISSLIDLQGVGAEDDRASAGILAQQLLWAQVAMAGLALVSMITSGYAIIRSVSGRLSIMQRTLEALAAGDLDNVVPFAGRRR